MQDSADRGSLIDGCLERRASMVMVDGKECNVEMTGVGRDVIGEEGSEWDVG